jgi:hypothetical protein
MEICPRESIERARSRFSERGRRERATAVSRYVPIGPAGAGTIAT